MAEDNVQANIRIGIDTSDALASIKNLQRQISAFHTSMSNGSAANAVAANNFSKTLIDNINATKKFSASIQTVKTTTETFTNSLEKNKLSLGQYFRYAGAASKSFGRMFSTEFDTINKVARERVKDLQTQYIKLGRDANGAMKAIAVRPLVLDMDNLATKTAIAAQRQQLLNQLLKQGSTNLLNFGKNTQWAGRQLMVGFTIPLSIFGSTAAKSFMTIEEQAIKFKRVYGDLMTDSGQTDAMLESIKTLALEFTKYGVAVDKTMGLAAAAAAQGKTGADLTAQVSEATRLSVLGQVEQQQALETTISVTNAFGVAAEDLASKIDFLNAVENQTVTSIEDLTIAVPKAGPVIKQLGGSVEDLAFFLTAMKEGGINASEGANALKSGLASLINPTAKASEMLAGYGINIKKIVEGNKGDVKGTVIDFATALDKLDPLARARAIEQLFGKFQFSRLSTLFQNVIGEGTQAQKVLDMAGQTSEQLAELSSRELGKISESSMFKFKKSIEDIKVALAPIGETFLKLATPVIEFGTKILNAFNSLDEKTKNFMAGLVAVVGGIGPILLMTFGLLANGIANIVKGFTFVKNVFNKASVSSNDLGSQISYMTSEQLKAAGVAASLDQVHNNLIQTFSSEAGAINLYTDALKRASSAASAFNVPAVGRSRPARKMAGGGMVVGPGGPKDDLVPTDLSNGEAVIDAATVKKNPRIIGALFAGKKINIPGYANNNSGQFAHVEDRERVVPAGTLLDALNSAEKEGKVVSKKLKKLLEGIVTDIGKDFRVRAYSGLGFTQKASLNNAMQGNMPVSSSEFLADFQQQGSQKWNRSIKLGGGNLKDVELQAHLQQYDNAVTDGIKSFINLTGSSTITSEQFSKIESEARRTLPEFSQLRSALDNAEQGLFEVRANLSQAALNSAGISLERPQSSTGNGLSSKASGRFSTGTYVRAGGNRAEKTSAGSIGGILLQDIESGILNGVRVATDQNSPSKEAFDAGVNIGKGAIQGIESTIPEAKNVGRGNRRVTAAPDGSGGMIIMRPQARRQSDKVADSPAAKTSRRAVREGDLEARARAEKDATAATVANTTATKSFGSSFRNVSYALSGLSTVAMLSGQMVGDFGNIVFGASMALSALTTAAELNAASGFIKLGPLANGAKGLSGFFSRVVNIGGKAVMSLGRFAGIVGIAITAITGMVMLINWVNKEREKERLKIEGLGDAATMTKDKLGALGTFFGKATGPGVFDTIGTKGAGVGPMSTEKQTEVKNLREDEGFQDKFATDIEVLSKATTKQAVKTFETISMTLFSQGYTKDQVQTVINALKIEAGKTDVVFEVKSFDIKTKKGKANFKKSAENMVSEFNKAFTTGRKKVKTVTYDSTINNMMTGTKEEIKTTKEYDEALKTNSANIMERFTALQGMLNSGQISAKEYREQWDILSNALKTGAGSAELTKAVFGNFTEQLKVSNPEFAALMPSVKGTNSQIAIMQAVMAGAIPTVGALTSAIADLKTVQDYESGVSRDTTAYVAAKARVANLAKTVDDLNKRQEEANDLVNDYNSPDGKESAFTTAKKQIAAQTKELQNQISAFNKLKSAGYTTEKAFTLAKDPILAAALASTKVGSKQWKELTAAIKASENAAKKFKAVQKQTLEGATEEFDKAYGNVGERFAALEEQLQLAFNKANKTDTDLIATSESQIAALSYTLDNYNAALDDIQLQEDLINNKYDKRIDALDKVQNINDEILRQQKSQLSIADALTQGDISAAAKAVQDARSDEAQARLDSNRTALENSRNAEVASIRINGKSRVDIEKSILDVQAQIKKIEEDSLEPAQERVRIAEEKLQSDISALTVAEKTKSEWDVISNNIKIAKTNTDEFVASINSAISASQNLSNVLAGLTTKKKAPAAKTNNSELAVLSAPDPKWIAYVDSYEQSLRNMGATEHEIGTALDNLPISNNFGMASGGIVPKYLAAGGIAKGTDTIPAMLTPGEFVVKKYAVKNFGVDNLKSINNGTYKGDSVYNYELNINMSGSNLSADDVAKNVMSKIKQIDSRRIRGNTF